MKTFSFHRAHLAKAYCDSLMGQGIANATSGLFLAGPRRVGKTTFLREDLIPEAQTRSWQVVYIDLWSNKQADPSILIIEVIKRQLELQRGKLEKLTKQARIKINLLKTIEFDFSQPGLPENITLTDLLNDLITLANKPLLLIIDEAQHALTSPQGINTMFAIKSARDQINSSHTPKLMLVLTGSNRDKLAQLVIKKDQPFFGSEIIAFPLLGRDYTDFFTQRVNDSLADNNQFSPDRMWDAFKLIGHKPEILRQVVGQVAINQEADSFSELLKHNVHLWHNQVWDMYEQEYGRLPLLQQAILKQLIIKGQSWSPFSEDSMLAYEAAIGQSDLSTSSVQTAIQGLRDSGLIWQSSRGQYALEDESFGEWFKFSQVTLQED